MREIHKKIHPEHFAAVKANQKLAELRQEDDVCFEVGDLLILEEWDPESYRFTMEMEPIPSGYTGRRVERLITHVLRASDGLAPGWAVVSSIPVITPAAFDVPEPCIGELDAEWCNSKYAIEHLYDPGYPRLTIIQAMIVGQQLGVKRATGHILAKFQAAGLALSGGAA